MKHLKFYCGNRVYIYLSIEVEIGVRRSHVNGELHMTVHEMQ